MTGSAWGGSEELWFEMVLEARREKHEVAVMLCRAYEAQDKLEHLREAGVQLLSQPRLSTGSRLRRTGINLLNSVSGPFHTIADWRPDILFISQGSTYDVTWNPAMHPLLDLLKTRRLRYTVICQMNEDAYFPNEETRRLSRDFFQNAARVLFVSRHNCRITQRQLARTIDRATVVCNPVNLHDVTSVPWPADPVVQLACVARLQMQAKGQDILLEALSSMTWPRDQWHVNLYGKGPDLEFLTDLARHYGLSTQISLHGQVSSVRSIWEKNHILLLPSRYEGTPMAMIEAMLCGRPCVVTDVGGAVEWITEPQNGFIAQAPTSASFAGALDRAWTARNQWESMGTAAHQTATGQRDLFPEKTLLRLLVDSAGRDASASDNI